MIDFNKIDGYEFEELILKLLRTMGFMVEQTALSGDGGIDIIACDDRPITKGKYIIQCKNWTSTVGEPPIRDLYGVVMSERANKGVLITTSSFTKQADNFAKGKNLELIDYTMLTSLFAEYNYLEMHDSKLKRFYEMKEFDKEKYTYLKDKINKDKSNILYYEKLQELFNEYVLTNQREIIFSGLLEEYIGLNNDIIKRFYKNKKGLNKGTTIMFTNAHLYLLNGEIFKAMEPYYELDLFNSMHYGRDFKIWNKEMHDNNKEIIDSRGSICLRNLIIVFKVLKSDVGLEIMNDAIIKIIDKHKKIGRSSGNNFITMHRDGIEILNQFFNNTNEIEDEIIFHPKMYKVMPKVRINDPEIQTTYYTNFKIDSSKLLMDYYTDKNKIKDEINKLDLLLK